MMQMMKPSKNSMKVIWTSGALSGVCLGILSTITLQFAPPPLYLVGLIPISIVGFLVGGMLAAKQTGLVRTGTLAGLVAGLTCGITICAAIGVLGLIAGVDRPSSTDGNYWTIVLLSLAWIVVIVLISGAGLGAGLGALGGLIGKRNAKVLSAGSSHPPL